MGTVFLLVMEVIVIVLVVMGDGGPACYGHDVLLSHDDLIYSSVQM